jgi:large subunit ribosomal protein L14e
VKLGQIVVSKAGRDAGRKFIVVKILDELHLALSDGDLRKIEKAKKKKIKHITETDYIACEIAEKLANGTKITNAEIKKALEEVQ